jgi:signal transduction histidine kinase
MIDPNALVFAFGAISTATIGLVFLFKYRIADRQTYDRDWALAHLLFAAAIGLAAVQYDGSAVWPGIFGVILFWAFFGKMVQANLAFAGRSSHGRPLLVLCAALTALSLALGFYHVSSGLLLFAVVSAALFMWTGFTFRNLPQVGTLIFLIFTIRAILVLVRPYFADSPYLFQFSIVSFTSSFAVGAALLAGSLIRSRDTLLRSQQGLSQANADLMSREVELQESNRLLEEQAVRLERLGSDYAMALQRAEQANRAKDSFISNMNHEFRTPLNAVLGFTELIQADATSHGYGKITEYSGYAHDAGRMMLRNVDRILTFVALDSGQRQLENQSFQPQQSVCGVVDMLQEFATRRGATVTVECDHAPEAWRGDEKAFRAIVDELLRNAVKAAPDGTSVVVHLGGDDRELMVRIVDSGSGLSDKFLRTVGDLFNISENVLSRGGAKQGVGLGLSIAARYARLMGGALTLERNQPNGTIARVLIAAAPPSPPALRAEQVPETSTGAKQTA